MMELTKYKICLECGKQNPPSLLECKFCEADLTGVKVIDAVAAPTTPQPSELPNKSEKPLVRVCECGAENPPQARKCKACGEDISDIIPTHTEQECETSFSYELRSVDGIFTKRIDKPMIVVGREAELKEYLQSRVYVSRRHARLTVIAGKVLIENLSHTNKTYLNNEVIPDGTPTSLKNGDEIGLGGKSIDGNRQDKAAYLLFQIIT